MNEPSEENVPVFVSGIITSIKDCLDAYNSTNSTRWFFESKRKPDEIRYLRIYKKHLEVLLEENGDQEINWLHSDYYMGRGKYGNYLFLFLFEEENIEKDEEKTQEDIEGGIKEKNVSPISEWKKKFLLLLNTIRKSPLFRYQKELNSSNGIAACDHDMFPHMSKLLIILWETKLLEANFEELKRFKEEYRSSLKSDDSDDSDEYDWRDLVKAVEILREKGLLTQENLNFLLDRRKIKCFSNSIYQVGLSISYFVEEASSFIDQNIFENITKYNVCFYSIRCWFGSLGLTKQMFDEMVSCCEKYEDLRKAKKAVESLCYTYYLSQMYVEKYWLDSLDFLYHGSWFSFKPSKLPTREEMLRGGKGIPTVVFQKIPFWRGGGYETYLYDLLKDGEAEFRALNLGWGTRYNLPTINFIDLWSIHSLPLSKRREHVFMIRKEMRVPFRLSRDVLDALSEKFLLKRGDYPPRMVDSLLPYSDILSIVRPEFGRIARGRYTLHGFFIELMDGVIQLCQKWGGGDFEDVARVIGIHIYKYWLAGRYFNQNPCSVKLSEFNASILYSVRKDLDKVLMYKQAPDFWDKILSCCDKNDAAAAKKAVIDQINTLLNVNRPVNTLLTENVNRPEHQNKRIVINSIETVMLKLPQVVIEKATDYLTVNPGRGGEVKQRKNFSPIASEIEKKVTDHMWKEFGKSLSMEKAEFDKIMAKGIGDIEVQKDFWKTNPQCLWEKTMWESSYNAPVFVAKTTPSLEPEERERTKSILVEVPSSSYQ